MPFSLYEATVPTFQQTLGAVLGLLDKAESFCTEKTRPVGDLLQARIFDDMLPFAYQVKATVTHSLGALDGVRKGVFTPDRAPFPQTIDDLRNLVSEALDALAAETSSEVDSFVGRDMRFEMGDMVLPFVAEGFLMSFSMPNFFFHAATAYDILRMNGVELTKRDYLGRPRLKVEAPL
jgi:hypothetical protein